MIRFQPVIAITGYFFALFTNWLFDNFCTSDVPDIS